MLAHHIMSHPLQCLGIVFTLWTQLNVHLVFHILMRTQCGYTQLTSPSNYLFKKFLGSSSKAFDEVGSSKPAPSMSNLVEVSFVTGVIISQHMRSQMPKKKGIWLTLSRCLGCPIPLVQASGEFQPVGEHGAHAQNRGKFYCMVKWMACGNARASGQQLRMLIE